MSGSQKTVCCCCSLRTANLVLGWLSMIFSTILFLAVASILLYEYLHPENEYFKKESTRKNYYVGREQLDLYLNMLALIPVISGCQLYGMYKLKREFLMASMVAGMTELVFNCAMFFFILRDKNPDAIVGEIFVLLMYFYSHYIQYEFYKTIPCNRQLLVNEEETMS